MTAGWDIDVALRDRSTIHESTAEPPQTDKQENDSEANNGPDTPVERRCQRRNGLAGWRRKGVILVLSVESDPWLSHTNQTC